MPKKSKPPIPIVDEEGFNHSASAYKNNHCRCDVCKAEWAALQTAYRRERGVKARPEGWGDEVKKHGTRSRYVGSSGIEPCRCEKCREANRIYSRDAYRRKQAELAE